MMVRRWLAAGGALLVLLLVNLKIVQSEHLLTHGRSLYLQLAPVDPRSIMQGDYMTLNFELAEQLRSQLGSTADHAAQAVVSLDARGVGHSIRSLQSASSNPPGAGELLLNYRRDGWRIHLATDAYFFEEGQGARYERARFGHFRVDGKGRALLVELCDETLRAL
jgi:uncharacterized membrane-anchored protein